MPTNFKIDPAAKKLLGYEDKDEQENWESAESLVPLQRQRFSLRKCLAHFNVVIPWTSLLITLLWVWSQYRKRGPNNPIFPQLTYSPAQEILQYEMRKFELGFNNETTIYQGYPSPEIDQRWNDLYMMGVSKIPKSEAVKLLNQTAVMPNGPDEGDKNRGYIVELDVFHQLHCLNMIRKALSPDYYPHVTPGPDGEDELLGFHHVNHCVDAIRQSLMCTVDVTPLVWQWSDERQMLVEKATVVHTCRNFNRVRDWAKEYMMTNHGFDVNHREVNDPLDPATWDGDYHGE